MGIILALLAIIFDAQGRYDFRVVTAWQLVTTRAPGNSGKIEALEFLNQPAWFGISGPKRASLQGINLGPPENSSDPNAAGAYLVGIDLREADLRNVVFTRADISGALLSGADLSGADLKGVVARNANLAGATVDSLSLAGAHLTETSMTGWKMSSFDTFAHYRKHIVDYESFLYLIPDVRFAYASYVDLSEAVIIGGSLRDTHLAVTSESTMFLGTDVSGAEIYFKSFLAYQKTDNPPVGYVWAEKSNPPTAKIPPTINYFECLGKPTMTAIVKLHGSLTDAEPQYNLFRAGMVKLSSEKNCILVQPASLKGYPNVVDGIAVRG